MSSSNNLGVNGDLISLNKRVLIESNLEAKTQVAREDKERWERLTPEEMVNDQTKYLIKKYGKYCTVNALKYALNSLKKKIEDSKISIDKKDAITTMERGVYQFYKNKGIIINGNDYTNGKRNGKNINDSIDLKVNGSSEITNKNNDGIKYNITLSKEILGAVMNILNGSLPNILKTPEGIKKVLSEVGDIAEETYKDEEDAVKNLSAYFKYIINNNNNSKIQIDYRKVLDIIKNNNSYKGNKNSVNKQISNYNGNNIESKETYNSQIKMERSEEEEEKQTHILSLFKILKNIKGVKDIEEILKDADNKIVLGKEIEKITSYCHNKKINVELICAMSNAVNVVRGEIGKYTINGKVDIAKLTKAYKNYLDLLTKD